MQGRYEAWSEVREAIAASNGDSACVLDLFNGRGMIPLEAARLGLKSFGVDYSPVAVLAGELLTDYPFRDWSQEPHLPYASESEQLLETEPRLVRDVAGLLNEIGARVAHDLRDVYPYTGVPPWGYLWAVTLPCQECGLRFPLVGSYVLRNAGKRKDPKTRTVVQDPGQSFFVEVQKGSGTWNIVVHDGPPGRQPTLVNAVVDGKRVAGKSAVCPFCAHVHPVSLHRRLTNEGMGEDALLVVGEHDPIRTRIYRPPTSDEVKAASEATKRLQSEESFGPGLPAIPAEGIAPGNNNIIGPSVYGARTYGDFMVDRQTLAFVTTCRVIGDISRELLSEGFSREYTKALSSYAAAVVARKLRRSTRGCTLQPARDGVTDIYANQGSLTYSYDFFEAGIGTGPGTWASLSASTVSTLKGLMQGAKPGLSSRVSRGSATSLMFADNSMSAVVTDPPYDEMLAYSDSSDLIFSWVRRALAEVSPEMAVSADAYGAQEKELEIIVKRVRGDAPQEHRTAEHYDRLIRDAFSEARRVVADDGVVTIVFGHGEPEVWQRLLSALADAGLVMTGSWPANTESGSHQGKANIETTLTMSCRPAPDNRPAGRKGTVEAAIKREVKSRYPDWERWGLAPTDMLMAAAGPAMEIVGQYAEILDAKGDVVDIATFLPLARAAVQEAMAIEIDHHPLETFDARTRFALWWVRLFGREVAPKSELRWQALAASMDLSEVRDLVPDADKGAQFVLASKFASTITPESAVIDVALALASVSDQGQQAMAQVLGASGRDPQDAYLWAAVKFLADRLPDSDPDSIALNRLMRSRDGIATAVQAIEVAELTSRRDDEQLKRQEKLF